MNIVTSFTAIAFFLSTWESSASPTTGLCACQPSKLTFKFDFSLTCNTDTVEEGDRGVGRKSCSTSAYTTTDLVPIVVTDIQILELNSDETVLSYRELSGTEYSNGDSFSHERELPAAKSAKALPAMLHLIFRGKNQGEDIVTQTLLIEFDTDCRTTVWPILSSGQNIGWTTITEAEGPAPSFCSLMDPTESPTSFQSATMAPTSAPTNQIFLPTESPTFQATTNSPTTKQTETQCHAGGDECSKTSECCEGKICVSTVHKCKNCRTETKSCGLDSDCCDGLFCSDDGKCVAPTVAPTEEQCLAGGEECSKHSKCCEGKICLSTVNKCKNCRDKGNTCGKNSDCCDDLKCNDGKCVTKNLCYSHGTTCSKHSECCEGKICVSTVKECKNCQKKEKKCGKNSDCCDGLICNGDRCVTARI